MIILGSNSETRAKILQDSNIKFFQSGCDFDEDGIKTQNPKSFVFQATMGKLDSCIQKHGVEKGILVADTVVVADNKILRKAKSVEEAETLLLSQSGNVVSIITATIFKSSKKSFIDISSTEYKFREFEKSDLRKFLASEEWKGKAGACMVEGFCKKYIEEFVGFESCAMGLSLEKLKSFLV
jgi:septum formation protein